MDTTEKTGTDVKALKKERGTTKASVTRLLGSINSLMHGPGEDRLEEVKEKLENLTAVLDRLQEAHRVYMRGYRFFWGVIGPPPPYGCLQFYFAC